MLRHAGCRQDQCVMSVSTGTLTTSQGQTYRGVRLSTAAQSHILHKLHSPSRCVECGHHVYFQGAECEQVSHVWTGVIVSRWAECEQVCVSRRLICTICDSVAAKNVIVNLSLFSKPYPETTGSLLHLQSEMVNCVNWQLRNTAVLWSWMTIKVAWAQVLVRHVCWCSVGLQFTRSAWRSFTVRVIEVQQATTQSSQPTHLLSVIMYLTSSLSASPRLTSVDLQSGWVSTVLDTWKLFGYR